MMDKLSLLCLLFSTFAHSCSESEPCLKGCCSKYGSCGFGKEFCAKDTCINNCDQKAECEPGDFGAEYVAKKACPLNVCCSKWGYCGTSGEFCGDNKPKRPPCSTSTHTFKKVVGYYEAWSPNRGCKDFYPEQIPHGVYTHINFAFATIDPTTYQLKFGSNRESELARRLIALKKGEPDLKVFIAVGGWTFNDPGLTASVFSDIAADPIKMDKFVDSVLGLMSVFHFDGIDLDWEYPVAVERHGQAKDFENFPILMQRLKAALKSMAGRDGVSITLPASFWYLRHFDIIALEPHVDFFNIMTYDLHGVWDMPNQWIGPWLNAHTNLTETKEALDLIWRNNITPGKVVLGMAFYGRAYTLLDPSCDRPGCRYASGGARLACSNEIGIALNSEIQDIMANTNSKPRFDEEAAVKILRYHDDQWVTFDDEETFKVRANFARSQCLGGLMVWAISHDSSDVRNSLAVGEAAGRENERDLQKQCMWTNCLENCPNGYTLVQRTDGGAREGEHMTSHEHCSGRGTRQFCCPSDQDMPRCGWYNHNNGRCEPAIPEGFVEIGSTKVGCQNGHQAAACSTDPPSMHVWGNCHWTPDFPHCDSGSCESGTTSLFGSKSGSGSVRCRGMVTGGMKGPLNVPPAERRQYCCKIDVEATWEDCRWYDNAGIVASDLMDGTCMGGCPEGTYSVALETESTRNCRYGARAMCCKTKYRITKRALKEDEPDQQLKDALDVFLNFRDERGHRVDCATKSDEVWEAILTIVPKLEKILFDHDRKLFNHGDRPSGRSLDLAWDDRVTVRYPNLKSDKLRAWLQLTVAWSETGRPFAETLLCGLRVFDDLIGQNTGLVCLCSRPDCCDEGPCPRQEVSDNELETRATKKAVVHRIFSPILNAFVTINLMPMPYPESGVWDATDNIRQTVIDFYTSHCNDVRVVATTARAGVRIATEHIFEAQTLKAFVTESIAGKMKDGYLSIYGAIDPQFWLQTVNTAIVGPTRYEGRRWPHTIMNDLWNALGSNWNRAAFILCSQPINLAKGVLWRPGAPTPKERTMVSLRGNLQDPTDYLNKIRVIIAALNYLNNPEIVTRLVNIIEEIKGHLAIANELHLKAFGIHVHAVERFKEYMNHHFAAMILKVQEFVREEVIKGRLVWAGQPGPTIAILNTLAHAVSQFSLNKKLQDTIRR